MITNAFDPDLDAIIHPGALTSKIAGFPEVAVVCFVERVIDSLKKHYAPEQIDNMVACVGVPVYKINYGGKAVAVYCSTLGGSAAACFLEEMIAKGCGKFVYFGSCGVLNRDIAAKSLIVPTAAYRDEGTSYHYAPPSEYMEVATAPRLAEILTKLGVPHVYGKTWTTDAIFRETQANMEKRKLDGCLAVEMECASIMAVAQFRNAMVYQFLYAADSLDTVEWDARTLGNLPQAQLGQYLRIALEAAVRV